MFIYSVTIHISEDAESAWLNFMQHHHIADVVNTGYFTSASMRKVTATIKKGISTYNIEYTCHSKTAYEQYIQHTATTLRKDLADRFVGKLTAERTTFELIFSWQQRQ